MATDALPSRSPVVVIGGGPVGLVVSLLLSQHRIPHLVIERRRDRQRAPAAHVIRRRPMQILDRLGLGDEVRVEVPELPLDFVTWCVTLGGTEIGRLDLRPHDPRSGERGPEPWTQCSQNRLEPILLRAARARPEARVVLGTDCLGVTQDADAVTLRLRHEDGREERVRADWVVAADGAGSPTRRSLGIAMQGPGPLARLAMVHFEADLSPWILPRPGPIYWLMNPDSPGALIVHDPKRSHVLMLPRTGAEDDAEPRVCAKLQAALDVPVEPRILSVDHWSPHVQVADRYRQGRVLLVGDAAHRFPPTGGLGMNTGIQEAEVLTTLLARVAEGASETSLDGYERACRPAARANALESFENMKGLAEIVRVLGDFADRAGLERRVESLAPDERRQLDKAIGAQRSHFLSDGTFPGPTEGDGL